MHIQIHIILTNLFYYPAQTGADPDEGNDEDEAIGGDQGGKTIGHNDGNDNNESDNDDKDGDDEALPSVLICVRYEDNIMT